MPFPEDAGRVSIATEQIAQRLLSLMQRSSARGSSIGTRSCWIPSRHQRSPRRRTEGRNVEIGETNRLRMQTIQIRRVEGRIPMTGKITVPLIVRHDKNDIRRFGQERCGNEAQQTCGRWDGIYEMVHLRLPRSTTPNWNSLCGIY